MTVDGNVVRGIGEDELRLGVTDQPDIGRGVSGVGAQQQVRSKLPEVTGASDRMSVRIGRDLILGTARLAGGLPGFLQAKVDLGGLEARQLDLEVEVDQGLQLDRQDLPVPASLLGQPVVGKDVGPLLCFREVGEPNGRHDGDAEKLCRGDPPVPGDDLALLIDQNRIAEAKALYAFGNLADLLLGVCTRVVRVGPERFDRKHLHFEGGIVRNAGDIAGAIPVWVNVLRETRRVVQDKRMAPSSV